eukprot:866082_1
MKNTDNINEWQNHCQYELEHYRPGGVYLEFCHLVALGRMHGIGLKITICYDLNQYVDRILEASDPNNAKLIHIMWFQPWSQCDAICRTAMSPEINASEKVYQEANKIGKSVSSVKEEKEEESEVTNWLKQNQLHHLTKRVSDVGFSEFMKCCSSLH